MLNWAISIVYALIHFQIVRKELDGIYIAVDKEKYPSLCNFSFLLQTVKNVVHSGISIETKRVDIFCIRYDDGRYVHKGNYYGTFWKNASGGIS